MGAFAVAAGFGFAAAYGFAAAFGFAGAFGIVIFGAAGAGGGAAGVAAGAAWPFNAASTSWVWPSTCTLGQILAMLPFRSEERRVGKSVSVRVDLVGRRVIKKKKKQRTNLIQERKRMSLSKYIEEI